MSMVSIIMPTFRQAHYIRQSIDSVLSQNHTDLELLVVGVYGDDETLNIVRSYTDPRVKLILSNYAMITHQMNLGSYAAKGKYSMYFASDDILLPDSLNQLVKFSKKNNAVIAYPDYWFADEHLHKTQKVDTSAGKRINIVDVSFVKRKEHLLFLPLRFSDGMIRTERVWQDMLKTKRYRSRILHFPMATFLYRQHGKNVHNRGSQNLLSSILVGDKGRLPCDLSVKSVDRPELIKDNFTIIVVDPISSIEFITKWIFKRIIVVWTCEEDVMAIGSKYTEYPFVHHVGMTKQIMEVMERYGLSNVFLLDCDSLKQYIKEDRY